MQQTMANGRSSKRRRAGTKRGSDRSCEHAASPPSRRGGLRRCGPNSNACGGSPRLRSLPTRYRIAVQGGVILCFVRDTHQRQVRPLAQLRALGRLTTAAIRRILGASPAAPGAPSPQGGGMSRQGAAKAATSPHPSRASPCRCAAIPWRLRAGQAGKSNRPRSAPFPCASRHRVPRRFPRTMYSVGPMDQLSTPVAPPPPASIASV
jgi:hypothetical protein